MRRSGRISAGIALSLLTAISGLMMPAAAQAVTTVYEIEGEWAAGTPNPVETGAGLTSTWRYNINDAEPAPENPPHDNVTVTFSVQNAKFTEVADACLTTGVTPGVRDPGRRSHSRLQSWYA